MKGIVGSKEAVEDICHSINERVEKENKTGSKEIRALEREERSLNRKMENLLNIIEDGALSDVIRGRIKTLHERLNQISERLIELQDEDKPMLNADRVYEAIKVWQNAEDDTSLAAMFKAFISQIRVFPKTVEIDFFLDINGRKYIMKQKKRPV